MKQLYLHQATSTLELPFASLRHKAMQLYPAGTKFISLKSGIIYTSTGYINTEYSNYIAMKITLPNDGGYKGAQVYNGTKWAEIITDNHELWLK